LRLAEPRWKNQTPYLPTLMYDAIRELQVWNQLLVICLNTPPRPTWGHAIHFWDQAPSPPPFYQVTQQGCQLNGLELNNPEICLIFFRKRPSKILVHPPKFLDPPSTPPGPHLLKIDSFMYQSIALDVRIPFIWLIIQSTRDINKL